MEKNRTLFIKLYPEISSLSKETPPIASFIIRVVSSLGGRTALVHPGNFITSRVFVQEIVHVYKCINV